MNEATYTDTKAAVTALGALAQETRIAIFRHLVMAGEAGAPAGSIATALDVPAATLSFHLKALEHAGLIDSRRDSRLVIYSANYAGMRSLIDFLTEDCCKGHPAVCAAAVRTTTERRRVKRAR